ncbi:MULTISPECIES: non-hydrolyzing UDP-N-acetylglucosamine 2-epimerase [Bacilli]|nr:MULTISPECIES: UDP-N-acetylglucosamine 2-epimerase (non-hydrolyzing) [Bacilli]HDG8370615.1 UDP-N-acetylglucosamine 2-epimerase (non-hydrolyzing) [Staphylococcus aureus]MBE9446770.1 UDP-N-acetylglucosamine 2-epimerase (non-hydrolyzing) [Enterococcus faecalis]MCH4449337.1 UDP-N-acetylglucosamine 2-epimerase (non-hydrolyzing) [Staphylococcus haemolyticus]MDO0972335.1 UDP-N-acetylglucosamine 2-epimerase (non-hydrolyzing) [Staphylococcus haemolyticus]OFN98665.1 UDP-N-acetyl glucosamine 2-epimeras
MKKIMMIFGTRPEAIKMAPLVKVLNKSQHLQTKVVITAQHREMLDSVLDTFQIKPDYDLDIMKQNQSLSQITTSVIQKMENIIKQEKPDMVLVHGDTTTTFAGGLAAFYNQVPIGHVEAGLRTNNKYSPFPEEMNRQMVGILADLHFSPTLKSAENLKAENKNAQSISITGNTAIDAMKTTVNKHYESDIISKHKNKKIILLTAHRRENIGEPMHNIFKAIKKIVDENEDVVVIYPMHKNPKVREIVDLYLARNERIELIEPLEVNDFHNIANQVHLILTDSGGVQEEAPSLNKPVLVLRENTERPEGVEAGTLKVVGTTFDSVFENTKKLIEDEETYLKMSQAQNPYGDGFASERIRDNILYYFGLIDEKPKPFK